MFKEMISVSFSDEPTRSSLIMRRMLSTSLFRFKVAFFKKSISPYYPLIYYYSYGIIYGCYIYYAYIYCAGIYYYIDSN